MRKVTFENIVKAIVHEAGLKNPKAESKQFKPEELRIETDDTYEVKYDDITLTIEYNSTDTDKVRANNKNITYPVNDRMVSIFLKDETDKNFIIERDFFVSEYKKENGYRLHFSTYVRVKTPKGVKRVLSRANQVVWIDNFNKDWTETKSMLHTHRSSNTIFKIVNGL